MSGSNDYTVRIWNADSGECLKILEGHTSKIRSVSISSNSKKIVSAGEEGTIIWDLETGALLSTIPIGYGNAVFSPDGKNIAVGSHNELKVWNVESSQVTSTIKKGLVFGSKPIELELEGFLRPVYSPDGKSIAVVSERNIYIFSDNGSITKLEDHTDRINSHIFPSNKLVVSGSEDNTVRFWNIEDGNNTYITNTLLQK